VTQRSAPSVDNTDAVDRGTGKAGGVGDRLPPASQGVPCRTITLSRTVAARSGRWSGRWPRKDPGRTSCPKAPGTAGRVRRLRGRPPPKRPAGGTGPLP